jgi:hypothetical protein
MTRNLQLRGLGAYTQEAYLRAVRQLAAFYRPTPNQFNEEQLREYFLRLNIPAIALLAVCFCADYAVILIMRTRLAQPILPVPPKSPGGKSRKNGKRKPRSTATSSTYNALAFSWSG